MSQALRAGMAAALGLSLIAAAPIHLQSNRATYKVSLAGALPGGIVAVQGRIVIEFRTTCTGYATTQRFISDMTDAQDSTSRSDFVIEAWESRTGRSMRFDIANMVDGTMAEQYKGRASRDADGAGSVSLSVPKGGDFELPRGTLFPSMQTIGVLEAAEQGEHRFNRTVFQGGGADDLYYSTSTIGAEVPKADTARDAERFGAMLNGVRAWPVLMSYYTPDARGESPQYEIATRLYANGVIGSMDMIYPRFTLRAELQKVEKLSAPTC